MRCWCCSCCCRNRICLRHGLPRRLNVGHFFYKNRDNIQQTSAICAKAMQSTYNAAKRRMVSIPVPRFPVGMRRRYAPPPSPQDRSRQRRYFWQSRNSAQPPTRPLQAVNPATSILAPHGMPGVEYSRLSSEARFPDRQDSADPDAFVYPRSPGEAPSGEPYMTGALLHQPTPPFPGKWRACSWAFPRDDGSGWNRAIGAVMRILRGISVLGGHRGRICGGRGGECWHSSVRSL